MSLKAQEDGGMMIEVQGTSSDAKNALAKAFVSILKKSANQIQEAAFFQYKSNGNSKRPKIEDAETNKTVALRFIKRMKYDLLDHDVEYASEILAQYPKGKAAVDAAMKNLLESGASMPEWQHKYFDVSYALLELKILERNARGLSDLKIDLRYATAVLSAKTDYRRYLGDLLEFHTKFDLRNFPKLQQIVVSYFRAHPESLSDLHPSQNSNVEKFKKDFGLN